MSRLLLSVFALAILGSLPLSAHGWDRHDRCLPRRPRPVVVYEREFCPPPPPPPVLVFRHHRWPRHHPGWRVVFVP